MPVPGRPNNARCRTTGSCGGRPGHPSDVPARRCNASGAARATVRSAPVPEGRNRGTHHNRPSAPRAGSGIPGDHRPASSYVLRGRPHTAVIEVDDVEHFVTGHHVAGVAIAVHADVLVWRGGVGIFDALEQVSGYGLVRGKKTTGNAVVFQQVIERVMAEVFNAQGFAVFEWLGGSYGMQTTQQLAQTI